MDFWQALILGLVEGITEYLPVSSTGHLLITQRLIGIPKTAASDAYAIAIQAGAILAVLGLYRQRLSRMALGLLGRDRDGLRLTLAVAIAFLPAAILGLLFDDPIERVLFGPWPIVITWTLGGLVLLYFGKIGLGPKGLAIESVGWRLGLVIGLCQCAALVPGVSRSLATILGGVLAGLGMGAAVEFSFLLGLVTLGAATAYKTLQSGQVMMEAFGVMPMLVGAAVACVSAALAVRFLVYWLTHRGLGLFGWWRLGAAALVAALLLFGWM